MAQRERIRPPGEPLPGYVRAVRWAAGALVGLPAQILGGLSTATALPGMTVGDVPGAMRPVQAAGDEAEQARFAAAFDQAVQHVRSRLEQPGLVRVRLDASDMWTGVSTLGQRLVNADPTQADKVQGTLDYLGALFKERFGQGRETARGAVGGTAAMVAHPVEAATGTPITAAVSALPALSAGRLATAAAGARLAQRGGLAGRVGAGLEAGARASESPQQFVRAGETTYGKAAEFVGKPQLETRLAQLVATGALTADEAAEVLAARTPTLVSRLVEPGPGGAPSAAQRVVRAAKGAVAGQILGDVLPPGVGAVAGAVLPEAVRAAWGSLSPAARAAFWRRYADPTLQPTPEATEVARDVVEPHRALRSEIPGYFSAAAGRVRERGIQTLPAGPGTVARVPETHVQVRAVSPQGEIGLPVPEGDHALQQGVGQLAAQRMAGGLEEAQKKVAVPEGQPPPLAQEIAAQEQLAEAAGTTPKAQELAAGLATTAPAQKFASVPDDPRLAQLVLRTTESVNRSRHPDKQFRFVDVSRWFTDTLRLESLEMLRSPGFRESVVSDLAAMVPKGGRKAFEKALREDVVENVLPHALGPEPVSRTFRVGGLDVQLEAVLAAARNKLMQQGGPGRVREAMAEALERTGVHTATKTAEQAMAQSLWGELARFAHTDVAIQNVAEYATNMAARMLGERQSFPQLLPHAPSTVAAFLRDAAPEVVQQLAQRGVKATPQQVAALADGFALHGKKGALDFGWQSQAEGPMGKVLSESSRFGEIPALPQGHKVYAAPGFAETVNAELSYLTSLQQANSMSHKLMQWAKLNITVRNPVTHVNNLVANAMLVALLEGRDPLSAVAGALDEYRGYRDWKQGRPVDPAAARKYQAITRTGVVDASNVDADWEILQHASGAPGALHQADKLAKSTYKLGDSIFKVRVASHTYDRVFEALDALEDGRTAWLDHGKGRLAPVKRVGDKFEVGGKLVGADSDALSDVVGRAAVEPAKALFFDYGDKPLYLRWATGPSAGIGSVLNPVMTWSWKATDLPGKPGLVSYLLDYDGTVIRRTDSPRVLAAQAGLAMQSALKRTAMLQAQAATLSGHRDELRKLVGADRRLGAIQLAEITDPRNVTWRDASPSSAFGPSALVWRLGQAAISQAAILAGADELAFPGVEDGKFVPDAELEPWQKKLRKVVVERWTGEDVKPRDALAIAGVTGGFLGDLITGAAKAERAGQDFDWGRGLLRLTTLAVGGYAGVGVDVGVGLAGDPGSALTSRYLRTEGPNEMLGQEDAVRFVARKLLGLGWRDAFVKGDVGTYLDRMAAELEGSLLKGLEKRSDKEQALQRQAEREGRAADAAIHEANVGQVHDDMQRPARIIRQVVGEQKAAAIEALKVVAPRAPEGAESALEEEP